MLLPLAQGFVHALTGRLAEVLQATGVLAVLLALYFLLPWPSATLYGGIVVVVVGVLLEIGRRPERPGRAQRPGGDQ